MENHPDKPSTAHLRAEIEKLEKSLPDGVNLASLPKSCDNLLEEFATIWMKSGVECLDKTALSEVFLTLQRQRTDNALSGNLLTTDIESLEKELAQDQEEVEMLQKFLEGLEEKSPDQIKKEQLSLGRQLEDLNQKTQRRSTNINLDQLIRKVELLETHSRGQTGAK